jgi:hypothetical protein
MGRRLLERALERCRDGAEFRRLETASSTRAYCNEHALDESRTTPAAPGAGASGSETSVGGRSIEAECRKPK